MKLESSPSVAPASPASNRETATASPAVVSIEATAAGVRSSLIDAWRALSCSIVVIFHAVCGCHSTAVHPFLQPILDHGKVGWIGRNLLFMLSGYCLARSLERRAGDPRPLAFWRDRILRIYLTYWAALLTAFGLALAATPFNGLPATAPFPASALAWLGDLSLTHIWMSEEPKLTVSWSLSFEIGFYLIVGAALLHPFREARTRVLLVAGITALSIFPAGVNYFPLLRLWPVFACGLAVHAALSPGLPRSFRLLALAYPAVLAFAHLPAGGDQVSIPALLSLVFLATLALRHRLPAAPRFVSLLGAASYSVFLLHIPAMSPALNLAKRLLPTESAGFAVVWLLHIFLGFAAGLLFYRWVERPIEAWRRRVFPSSASLAPAAPATAP